MKAKNLKILIIEDEPLLRLSLVKRLEQEGQVFEASCSQEALDLLRQYEMDIAFIDLDLEKKLSGLNILKKIDRDKTYSIVLSGREEEAIILEVYDLGARDFLSKPFNSSSVNSVLKKFNFFKNNYLKKLQESLSTKDKSLENELKIIQNAIVGDQPIFISGESGVGKTYLAKFIHELTGANQPFIHLNCAEISESLVESELFGHEKGAFTGAVNSKKGLLELANNGFLFLDEIATLPMQTQKKLLKAIDEKTFYPLGSESEKHSQFRLMTATCENLKNKVQRHEFREDLYYRLIGYNINLKPLRERKEDLPLLIQNFFKCHSRRVILEDEAKELLLNYHWPGNIRELQKVVNILSQLEIGLVKFSDVFNILKNLDSGEKINPQNDLIDFELVKEIGLSSYIEKIEEEVVRQALRENGEKVRKTLTQLKLSNNAYYRIISQIKKQGEFSGKIAKE